MRLLFSRPHASRLLVVPFLVLSTLSHLGESTPTPVPAPLYHDERDLSSAIGNLAGEFSQLINDTATLLQSFVQVIQELNNATNENDLVNLLGIDVNGGADGAENNNNNNNNNNVNGTVSAVGANVTCPGMAVLFARGTAEPGNVGIYTGPPFFTALRNYINGSTTLALQGVPYPATIPGFLAGGSSFGSAVMAVLANKTAAACPNTKVVLAGYSQGAQLVHNAMQKLSANTTTGAAAAAATTTGTKATTKAEANANATAHPLNAATTSKISSIVLFGDPRNGTAIPGVDAGRVLSLCHAQDDICAKGGDIVTLDHLTYSENATMAAMFVMQKSALGLMSSDAVNQGMGNVPVVQMAKGQQQNRGQQVGTGLGLPGF